MKNQPGRITTFQLTKRLRFALTSLLLMFAPTLASAISDKDRALRYDPPVQSAQECDGGDFGTVQIRIGLHSSLQACYKNVSATGQPQHRGTAFITIPREFEGRSVSLSDFHILRDDIVKSENEIYEKALAARAGKKPVAKAKPEPVPLGIFDHDTHRVGYAYAFAVPRTGANGKAYAQAMIRLESFVLVGDKVVVLMMITPVQSSEDAAQTFNLSEAWARAIIALNEDTNPSAPKRNGVSEDQRQGQAATLGEVKSANDHNTSPQGGDKERGKGREINQLG